MRYWVYINDKVIEKPFEEGELASIPGFNSDTLICKETPAEGETQEWVPAKTLIAAYKQPVPPPPPAQPNVNNKINQEAKTTILSGNIFGSPEENQMHMYKPSSKANTDNAKTNFNKTEILSPQEKASFEEENITDQATELVSIDDVKEVDVDNHNSAESSPEDDILRTAIKNLITPEKKHSEEQTFQAIDIAHNRNIDLSDPEEENIDKIVANLSNKQDETKNEEASESVNNEAAKEAQPEPLVEHKTDFSDTKLTLMGASKTGINHLFEVDDNQSYEGTNAEQQPKQEEKKEEVPAEQIVEVQEQQPKQEEKKEEVPAEQIVELTEQQPKQEEKKEEVPAEQIVELTEQQPKQEEKKEEVPAEQIVKPIEQKPLSEEEFVPEEEISLEDDDFIVEDLNNNKEEDIINKEDPSAKEQEVLKELAADKEEDLKASKAEEEELEEAFKTSPALVSELTQENKSEEIIQESNNILEPSQEIKSVEDFPTTLEELTGKFPMPQQETQNKEENKEEDKKEEAAASENPDIAAEENNEDAKEEPKQEGDKKDSAEMLDKDNFLTTFSSDIETVFLDQPTAFISDYIPPEQTQQRIDNEELQAQKDKNDVVDIKSEQGQHEVQNVRRVKPVAIKTVPMVEGEQIDPFSKTQIKRLEDNEANMARIEKKNDRMNIILTFGLFFIVVFVLIGVVGLMAQLGIAISKDFSPIHVLIAKVTKKPEAKQDVSEKKTPEQIAMEELEKARKQALQKMIDNVKAYQLMEGITLGEKIKILHQDIYDDLTWEASQLPSDPTYYSVTVTSPVNAEGNSKINYRFNYNTVTYTVEATTSESNNIMLVPLSDKTKR